jgi:hypothetical protein
MRNGDSRWTAILTPPGMSLTPGTRFGRASPFHLSAVVRWATVPNGLARRQCDTTDHGRAELAERDQVAMIGHLLSERPSSPPDTSWL